MKLDPVIRHDQADEEMVAEPNEPSDASWSRPTHIGISPMTGDADIAPARRLRQRALWSAGWRCAACGARCALQVDHILSRARFPLLIDDESNLAVLCATCHRLKTEGLLHIERELDGSLAITHATHWRIRPKQAP